MSKDPRYAPPRCGAIVRRDEGLRTVGHSCEFGAGHKGLHYSATDYQDAPGTPLRWGTPEQLDEEIAMREPDGIITVRGDLTPEAASAIRRAFRVGSLP